MANNWVPIPTAVLKEARGRAGLSYETMGRLISVSGKTYERYEKTGRAPRDLVPKLAGALGLEIQEPALRPLTIDLSGEDEDRLDRLERQLVVLDGKVELILLLLGHTDDQEGRPRSA